MPGMVAIWQGGAWITVVNYHGEQHGFTAGDVKLTCQAITFPGPWQQANNHAGICFMTS